MKTWVHFIGKAYYDPEHFKSESKKYGVTRRIALRALKRLDWGDRVLLLQGDMSTKRRKNSHHGSVLLGEFRVELISGLSQQAIEQLSLQMKLTKISDGGETVDRECGTYVEGPTYLIERVSLFDLAEELAQMQREGVDIGKPMIGGSFIDWDPIVIEFPDITFTWGFRPFDWEKFQVSIGPGPWSHRMSVTGDFAFKAVASPDGRTDGQIQEVKNYNPMALYHPLRKEVEG